MTLTPLEQQYRDTLDRLHTSMEELRLFQVAYGPHPEMQRLQMIVSVSLVAALEAAEANCRNVLYQADWSTVLTFYTHP